MYLRTKLTKDIFEEQIDQQKTHLHLGTIVIARSTLKN